jgi:GT2 family glycosyltransferase
VQAEKSHLPARPSVDVVVPFAGTDDALRAALARLARLDLGPQDTLVIADNRVGQTAAGLVPEGVRAVDAGGRGGSYFARNRGAEAGTNPWIVFLDADTEPPPDLVESYFEDVPGDRVAVLGGAVVDEEPAGADSAIAVRFAHRFELMSQDRTMARPEFAYVQTANCAVRRAAFEEVGGFDEEIRSGGDADLCFRLRRAGWSIERRIGARVVHHSRTTLRALLRQRARVGAGARWLEERYPGFAPRRSLVRTVGGNARLLLRGALAAVRGRREDAIAATLQGLTDAAFQVGWRLRNDAGLPRR